MSNSIINLGIQTSDDGRTMWRNNGGIIERKILYAQIPEWETVAGNPPTTPDSLREMCVDGGYGYLPPRNDGECLR